MDAKEKKPSELELNVQAFDKLSLELKKNFRTQNREIRELTKKSRSRSPERAGGPSLAQKAGEKDLSKLKAEMEAKGFDKSQRFQLTAYSSDRNPSNARRVSLMRAISIRSFLIKMGVEGKKITVRALGNNMDAELSNRVDIVLLN